MSWIKLLFRNPGSIPRFKKDSFLWKWINDISENCHERWNLILPNILLSLLCNVSFSEFLPGQVQKTSKREQIPHSEYVSCHHNLIFSGIFSYASTLCFFGFDTHAPKDFFFFCWDLCLFGFHWICVYNQADRAITFHLSLHFSYWIQCLWNV